MSTEARPAPTPETWAPTEGVLKTIMNAAARQLGAGMHPVAVLANVETVLSRMFAGLRERLGADPRDGRQGKERP